MNNGSRCIVTDTDIYLLSDKRMGCEPLLESLTLRRTLFKASVRDVPHQTQQDVPCVRIVTLMMNNEPNIWIISKQRRMNYVYIYIYVYT